MWTFANLLDFFSSFFSCSESPRGIALFAWILCLCISMLLQNDSGQGSGCDETKVLLLIGFGIGDCSLSKEAALCGTRRKC